MWVGKGYFFFRTIYSVGLLQQFQQQLVHEKQALRMHIKLDTGMHRLGVEEKDLPVFMDILTQANLFEVRSVFSHLVGGHTPELISFTQEQKNSLSA